jgi:Toc86/159 family protein import component
VNDGCIEEAAIESTNSVLEDSLGIEQYAEGQATASEVVEGVGVEKPSDVENVVAVVEDTDVKKYAEVEHAAAVVEGIDVEKLIKIENVTATRIDHTLPQELAPESSKKSNDSKESDCSSEVIDCEEKVDDDGIIKIVTTAEDGVGNEAYEHDDGANFDISPAWMAILESTESTKQIMKKFAEDCSCGSVSGLRDFTNSMDRQIILDGSKENDDNDDGAKKGFDSATLAALLEGATSETSYGNIKVSSQDGSEILTMDEPAGLGSSTLSLMPTAPCQHAQSNLFSSAELAVTADPTEEMTEEEKNLHDKVELIQVKFLRLVYRLGATFEETVTSQVLYRLSLVEGIMHMHGRQRNQDFNLDNARKKAFILEAEGKEDLNFTCNILVLGKTGVGKSATINSIFGEDKSKTDAFSSATTSVQEYIGDVHGIKIRIIDTPGFRASVMDQGSNRKILTAIKKYTKKCPPDIIVYVDRLDSLSHDFNDLPLLKTITSVLGSSVWFNAIVALTHAASAPPEGLNGAPVTYEVLMAQRSHIIHQSIRQAAGDVRLMNPIALVENHPSCRRNHEGHKVLPNGQSWRHQMLLLCYSSKILSEANSLLKSQDPNPREIFGFHFQPLPFMLSSLLQSRAHPKLSAEQGGNEGDFHIELDDYSNVQQDNDEEKHDQLLPFKPLTKAHLARVTRKQKKQWKDEICKFKEMKKRGETDLDDYGYANIADNVSVPLPNIVLPPSFDCDNPTYRYRFLEPTSTILSRPVLDAHGWDHDYGYDGVSMEETLAILDRFPANVAVQVTKDKKEFTIHMDSSIAAKHGENASSLAGFDIKTVGRQPVYILHGETKIIKNIKKNETTGGFSVTFLGDTVATGLKVEDQLSLGKRLSLVASTGAMQVQGDTAYGANLEACLNDKHYRIGQSRSTLGLSLMKWRRDLALGANLQSQFSIARDSKMALRLGLNNKLSGQITVRTSTSDQVQIALLGLVPVAASIYKSFRPSEPSSI